MYFFRLPFAQHLPRVRRDPMSFTVGQIEPEMGTFRFLSSVMLSASILFILASVLGPSLLLVGFAGFMVSFSVSNRDGLIRIMHSAARSIIVRVNHMLAQLVIKRSLLTSYPMVYISE